MPTRLSFLLFFSLTVLFYACNLEQKSYTAEINKMKDTLFQSFPSVNRVSVDVTQDFGTEINITLGDATLYGASENERQSVTNRTADIVRHVFPPDDLPEKGKVIFVKEENTIEVDEASKKIYEMDIAKEQ